MTFPAEPYPDGAIFAPHHLTWGLFLALFGFLFVWRYYPRIGASMVAFGLIVATDDWVSHALGWPTPLDSVWWWLKQ